MNHWLASCFDELEKIARLSREEERNQALQFAGLGAASVPVANAISNVIEHGKPLGLAKSFPRWLGARAATGGMIFGALPAARHALERTNVAKSKKRKELNQQLNQIAAEAGVPGPVAPMKPDLEPAKTASNSWMDGPPKKKSLEGPMKKLREHQGNAKPPKAKMKPVFPNMGGVDVMPKLGGVMDLSKDPLIRYLQKHGAKNSIPPMKVTPSSSGEMPDNEEAMPKGKEEKALASHSPMPGESMEQKADKQWRKYLQEKFDNSSGVAEIYTENDFDPAVGSVDKVLKSNKS